MSKYRVPEIPSQATIVLSERDGREAWLSARTMGIGGSDIAALIGASEYATPFDVFAAKRGAAKDISDKPEIEWGHRLEDAVAQKTADELGLVARTGGGLWQHPEYEFALVTPDRIATRKRSWKAQGVIECKTAGDDAIWANGDAPVGYKAQVQWQLGILGLDVGWIGCLVLNPQRDFYVVEVRFDPEWFAEMLNVAETFWVKHVLADEPPMHDLDHPRTTDLLKELYPSVVQPSVELPSEAAEWVAEYHEAKAASDAAERRLEAAKNYFRVQLADAGAGYIGDRKVVSFPEVTRRSIDADKLREFYPEAAAECEKTSTHRRLTVKKI